MQRLNAGHSRVGPIVTGEFLQPFVGDWGTRALGDLPKRDVRGFEQGSGLGKEVAHAVRIGNYFPLCQGAHSRHLGKEFGMASRPLPRATLSRNLRTLLAASGLTSPEVARKAGVDAKTMNNMLNGRYDPRPEKVDQVATVFGLTGWQLLIPGLSAEILHNGRVEKLLENYLSADQEGRDSINRVAEMAARYKKG